MKKWTLQLDGLHIQSTGVTSQDEDNSNQMKMTN